MRGSWQSTGMSMPALRAASQIVVPSGTSTAIPSIVSWIMPLSVIACGPAIAGEPAVFTCSEAARIVAANPCIPPPDPPRFHFATASSTQTRSPGPTGIAALAATGRPFKQIENWLAIESPSTIPIDVCSGSSTSPSVPIGTSSSPRPNAASALPRHSSHAVG